MERALWGRAGSGSGQAGAAQRACVSQRRVRGCCSSSPGVALQDLEKKLESADAALEEHHDRVAIMDEHLKNVQQELKYTQSRVGEAAGGKAEVVGTCPRAHLASCTCGLVVVEQVEAKAKEIESEKHLKALAEREAGRLRNDMSKHTTERAELKEKVGGTHTLGA